MPRTIFGEGAKAVQAERGSRASYARLEDRRGWQSELSPEEAEFVARRDSAFLGTADAAGQPYIQHRGGPQGFLRVLDARTLAFADYAGNRQYITTGNLRENDRAFLFLIDYAMRRRLKLWGRARASGEPVLLARVTDPGYPARVEQAIIFTIEALDWNCPQHIPRFLPANSGAARREPQA